MFQSSVPVTEGGFSDRAAELQRLQGLVRKLLAGEPSWVAILGPRKIGKTSLLLELARRMSRRSLVFAVLDSLEEAPTSASIFRRYALRVLDGVFAAEAAASVESLASRPAEYRAALERCARFARLPADLRASLLDLPERTPSAESCREWLELPERLAESLRLRFVVAWDEFQEVARLGTGLRAVGGAETLALVRSVWQRHRRVAYFISGSAKGMLRELTTSERSPFFQHFSLMDLGPLQPQDAVRLLVHASADVRPIPRRLACRAVEVLGGHPFHLQLLGEALVAQPRPLDESALKAALQELLFSRSGRLALYFENEFQNLVGRSTYLAAVLQALADGPKRLSEVARTIGASAGAAVRYVERLGDAVLRDRGGVYRLDDPVFGLWLRWRRPGGTVVPMTIIGDEAEIAVARHLARAGFDVVYQARASRGPFDLLATRADRQLAVQVRRMAMPLRFDATEWARMVAEGRRLGWTWVVAAVSPDGVAVLLDPRRAARRKGVTLGESAAIQNVLSWLDSSASPRRPR